MTQKYLNELTYTIIGAAIEIHKELGPGLLEGIYEKCMIYCLHEKGLEVSSQKIVPLQFKGIQLDCALKFDLLVENEIIVEIKAVEALIPLHEAQLLTYLKLLNKSKGVLINFNCTNIFKEGQKTFVTEKFKTLT
ncbi:MAG: GxxExxY protein [Bacteroidales bacterium]